MLQDLIIEKKAAQFDLERPMLVEGYDMITKKFLDFGPPAQRQSEFIHGHRRESEGHYSDSNGIGRLAHLADLAVGDGVEREHHHRRPDIWRSIGGEEGLDNIVKRQGYLSALQTLLQS